jgi:hypothetical protein
MVAAQTGFEVGGGVTKPYRVRFGDPLEEAPLLIPRRVGSALPTEIDGLLERHRHISADDLKP